MNTARVQTKQIGNNLKYWPDDHEVVSKTLQLFLDMASGYSSSKMLLGLDTVKFLMRNHTEEFFPFLVKSSFPFSGVFLRCCAFFFVLFSSPEQLFCCHHFVFFFAFFALFSLSFFLRFFPPEPISLQYLTQSPIEFFSLISISCSFVWVLAISCILHAGYLRERPAKDHVSPHPCAADLHHVRGHGADVRGVHGASAHRPSTTGCRTDVQTGAFTD